MPSARYASLPKKGVYAPNHVLTGSFMVRTGDVVVFHDFPTALPDAPPVPRIARVLDLVTHDHDGKEFRVATGRGKQTKRDPLLRVLVLSDAFSHAYERWIHPSQVREIRNPSCEGWAEFLVGMLCKPLPSPETVLAASKYGALTVDCFARVAVGGALTEGWKASEDLYWEGRRAENELKRRAQ